MTKTMFNLPGLPQHVVIRGKGIDPSFACDDDYRFYLDCLKQSAATFKCQLHAYVLMPDHVHMVITPEAEFGVSNMMQSLTRRYARYINETYQHSRPLWQKCYKASLIESRNYLFACMCYVEVNPVRAQLVDVPSEYKWSSYHANAYNKGVGMLHPHPMYIALGDDNESRSTAYLRLFCSRAEVGSVHTIRNALHQELILGSSAFKDSVEEMFKKQQQMSRAEKLITKKQAA